jgi:hypothetical protein
LDNEYISSRNTIVRVGNLKEATELYLDEFSLKEERKTLMTTFEVAISVKA